MGAATARRKAAPLVDEAVLRYLDEEVKKKSVNDDKLHLRWWQPRLEGMDLTQITRDVVDRYKQESQRSGLSDATTNRRLQVLRAILRRAALEWEWLDRVPRFRLLKEPQGRVRYLTREEAGRLLAELPEHLRAMARFSLATGLRQGNVKGAAVGKGRSGPPKRLGGGHGSQGQEGDSCSAECRSHAGHRRTVGKGP